MKLRFFQTITLIMVSMLTTVSFADDTCPSDPNPGIWEIVKTTDEGCDGTWQYSDECYNNSENVAVYPCDIKGNDVSPASGGYTKVQLNCNMGILERNATLGSSRETRQVYHYCGCIAH